MSQHGTRQVGAAAYHDEALGAGPPLLREQDVDVRAPGDVAQVPQRQQCRAVEQGRRAGVEQGRGQPLALRQLPGGRGVDGREPSPPPSGRAAAVGQRAVRQAGGARLSAGEQAVLAPHQGGEVGATRSSVASTWRVGPLAGTAVEPRRPVDLLRRVRPVASPPHPPQRDRWRAADRGRYAGSQRSRRAAGDHGATMGSREGSGHGGAQRQRARRRSATAGTAALSGSGGRARWPSS